MRKLIVYLITAALMVSMLAIPAFAAAPATESGIYDLSPASGYTNTLTLAPQKADGTAVAGTSVSVDGTDTTLYPAAEKINMAYSGASAGAYYLAVVIEAASDGTMPAPTEDNLTYIDQQTATAASGGTVEYTLFPKEMKAGKTYLICLSGNGQALTQVASFKYFEYSPYKLGDVDEDGSITSGDALYVLQTAAGQRTLKENLRKAAVADKDGSITSGDALFILQAAAGIRQL